MFGWQNCYKLTDGKLELVATADVGPRIIFFGEIGGKNLLSINGSQAGRSGDQEWLVYGGHRVWAAPEDPYFSYLPDNSSVRVSVNEMLGEITLTCTANETNLQKTMILRVATGGGFVIRDVITNCGPSPIRTASWGITAFIPGGTAMLATKEDLPENRLQAHFSLNLWPYTDLSDPCFDFTNDLILIYQQFCKAPQKIGAWMKAPCLSYLLGNHLVVMRSNTCSLSSELFPDRGSNIEIYVNPDLLELEFLSPWKVIGPGESVWHEQSLELLIKKNGSFD